MTKCECGCGGEAKPGNRFINGHYTKIHPPMKGKKHKKKSIQKMSKSHKTILEIKSGKKELPFCACGCGERVNKVRNKYIYGHNRGGQVGWNKGLTKETDERVMRHSEVMKGRTVTIQVKNKLSELMMGDRNPMKNPEIVFKCMGNESPAKRPEVRKKLSEAITALWKDPEYVEKMTEARIKGQQIKPNRPERQIETLLNQLLPNEYKINVKGEVMTLGRKIPDFVNVNGQKKLIEFNGDYWHTEEETEKRVELFKSLEYETLVIWEHEMEDMKLVVDKILDFNRY